MALAVAPEPAPGALGDTGVGKFLRWVAAVFGLFGLLFVMDYVFIKSMLAREGASLLASCRPASRKRHFWCRCPGAARSGAESKATEVCKPKNALRRTGTWP